MNRRLIKTLIVNSLIAVSLVSYQACNSAPNLSQVENETDQTENSVGVENLEDAEITEAKFQAEQDEAVTILEQQHDKISQDIDKLEDEMDTKRDKAKAIVKRQVDKLKTERQDLNSDIDIVRNSTGHVWKEVKTGLKKAGRTLGDSFNETGDRLE